MWPHGNGHIVERNNEYKPITIVDRSDFILSILPSSSFLPFSSHSIFWNGWDKCEDYYRCKGLSGISVRIIIDVWRLRNVMLEKVMVFFEAKV
jgi:hypothetical protein